MTGSRVHASSKPSLRRRGNRVRRGARASGRCGPELPGPVSLSTHNTRRFVGPVRFGGALHASSLTAPGPRGWGCDPWAGALDGEGHRGGQPGTQAWGFPPVRSRLFASALLRRHLPLGRSRRGAEGKDTQELPFFPGSLEQPPGAPFVLPGLGGRLEEAQ